MAERNAEIIMMNQQPILPTVLARVKERCLAFAVASCSNVVVLFLLSFAVLRFARLSFTYAMKMTQASRIKRYGTPFLHFIDPHEIFHHAQATTTQQ